MGTDEDDCRWGILGKGMLHFRNFLNFRNSCSSSFRSRSFLLPGNASSSSLILFFSSLGRFLELGGSLLSPTSPLSICYVSGELHWESGVEKRVELLVPSGFPFFS